MMGIMANKSVMRAGVNILEQLAYWGTASGSAVIKAVLHRISVQQMQIAGMPAQDLAPALTC